ncbi:MAG: hypothetical protein FJ077_11800 [Cyanobacteria bacterium K_DeepCast_35m_m2_023]|nr:hypothetical protein [Cyanobacteria bacterium K_DeepCast_35m_m2_023]
MGAVTVSDPNGNKREILPTDAGYANAVRQQLTRLAITTLARDARAFSPEKAALAFSNPSAVLESEGISIGEVTSSVNTTLPSEQGRFAFALTDPSGSFLLSPLGLTLNSNSTLDNTVHFGSGQLGNQVVMAPAQGEVFVVDDIYANEDNPVVDGKLKFNLNVANFGTAKSYGLFRADDPAGRFHFVNGVHQGTAERPTPLEPGSIEYAQEAVRRSFSNSLDGITGLPLPAYGTNAKATIDLAVGNAYGLYITPNQVLNPSSPVQNLLELRFSIAQVNENRSLQHVSMGTGYFSFEQSLVGSDGNDNDFNDLQFLIAPISPDTILT